MQRRYSKIFGYLRETGWKLSRVTAPDNTAYESTNSGESVLCGLQRGPNRLKLLITTRLTIREEVDPCH
jgi:hypothetical protein